MFRSRSRLAKTIAFSLLWIALKIPLVILVVRCTNHDMPMLENAIALQFADTVVAFFLIYRVIAEQINRVHRCPTCKGRKQLFGDDAIFSSLPTNPMLLATAPKCPTCTGKGFVLEQLEGTP